MVNLLRTPFMMLFLFLISCQAFAQVDWVPKLDEALKRAQSSGKFIVVDLFADWCPPCREMAKTVYPDAEFIRFSRSQIFMLLNAEADDDGIRLCNKFNVNSYPTILILDSRGQEIDRLVGGRDAKSLMRELQALFDSPVPYKELALQAKEKTSDFALQYQAGNRALERQDYGSARQFLGRAADGANRDRDSRTASLLLLSIACFKDGKYPEALAALDDFERLEPERASADPDLKLHRGRILIACKRYDEGYKLLNEILRSSRSRRDMDNAAAALSQLPGKYRQADKEYEKILDDAKRKRQKGKLESALALARQASEKMPQTASAHLLLGIIYLQMADGDGDPSKKSQHISAGLNELRLARRLDPEDMSIYRSAKDVLASGYLPQRPQSTAAQKSYMEAEARFAEARYGDAVKAYRKTMEIEPAFAKAYLHCGDCLFVSGRIEDALKLYQQAISKNPLEASAYRFAADALQKLGKPDESLGYLRLSLLADPEYPLVWQDLEKTAYAGGQPWQRHADLVPIQFLLLSIDANAYDESIYDGLPPQAIPAWREYVRSKLLWRQEKFAKRFPNEDFYHTSFEEEYESLEAAIRKWDSMKGQDASLDDSNLDFLRQISVDHQLAAFIYLELFTEEYRKSYEKWKKDNLETAMNYINTYLTGRSGMRTKGEYNSSAIEAYNGAIEAHRAGDRERASSLYLKALAQEPDMIPALRNASLLFMEMNDYDSAREQLEKWSKLEPSAADPYGMLSQICLRERDLETAADLLEKAVSLEKDSAKKSQYQKLLSGIQSAPGMDESYAADSPDDESEAEGSDDKWTVMERRLASLREGDEKDSLLLMLAVAHFEAKNWEKARSYASRILAKDPAQPTAKAIMESIRDKN